MLLNPLQVSGADELNQLFAYPPLEFSQTLWKVLLAGVGVSESVTGVGVISSTAAGDLIRY